MQSVIQLLLSSYETSSMSIQASITKLQACMPRSSSAHLFIPGIFLTKANAAIIRQIASNHLHSEYNLSENSDHTPENQDHWSSCITSQRYRFSLSALSQIGAENFENPAPEIKAVLTTRRPRIVPAGRAPAKTHRPSPPLGYVPALSYVLPVALRNKRESSSLPQGTVRAAAPRPHPGPSPSCDACSWAGVLPGPGVEASLSQARCRVHARGLNGVPLPVGLRSRVRGWSRLYIYIFARSYV